MKMNQMSREETIEYYNLSYDEIYDVPEPSECPACGELTLFPSGTDNYGADLDGRRGRTVYIHTCSECGETVEEW